MDLSTGQGTLGKPENDMCSLLALNNLQELGNIYFMDKKYDSIGMKQQAVNIQLHS